MHNFAMKKLSLFLAFLFLLGCGKSAPKPKIHVTSPLTYEETKAYLQVYDEAKAEQEIFQKKIAAYAKVVKQMNQNHKFADNGDYRVDDVNCPLIGDAPCERTIVSVVPPPPQVTVPPVKIEPEPCTPKAKTKEPAKK